MIEFDLDHLTHPLSQLSEAPHFRNKLISVSRMELYERCPYAFFLRYIQRLRGQPSLPLLFGSACHAPLEDVYQWAIDEEYSGHFPKQMLIDAWGKHYEEMGLTHLVGAGFEVYAEGQEIMRKYASNNPEIEHTTILAVEQRFEVQCGQWELLGFMDRVDRIDRDGKRIVRVNDYKTNRMLMDRSEAERKLQGTLYVAAAKKLYPWADGFEFRHDMLRHGIGIVTERSDEQIEAAFDYMSLMAGMSEKRGYPARVNTLCGWCDYRGSCESYQQALSDKNIDKLQIAVPEALEEISKERERAAALAKAADGRKKELEALIKIAFAEDGPVRTNGKIYDWKQIKARGGVKYDPEGVIELLIEKGMGDDKELRKKLLVIDNSKLNKFVADFCKKNEIKGSNKKELQLDLEMEAKISYSTRLQVRDDKGDA